MKSGVTAYKCLLGIGLLYFFGLLPYAQGIAAVTDKEIAVTPQGIRIQLHERALGEVLSRIQEVSGIRFSFPTAMGMAPITATIHARDWPSAVRELLRPFSTAEVWDKRRLARVYVLERSTANLPEESVGASESESENQEDSDTPEPPSAASLPLPPPPPPLPQRNQ